MALTNHLLTTGSEQVVIFKSIISGSLVCVGVVGHAVIDV